MAQENKQPALVQTVAATIDRAGLIPPGATVVVAVSGGVDSVAMLSLLRELAAEPSRQYRLAVAHLNHGLRAEAESDARFVAELTKAWGLPFFGGVCDARSRAAATGQGVEQAGRELRYEFLLQTAMQAGAARVAAGHHADDNAETILYRILRGTSLNGLKGIPIRRTLHGVTQQIKQQDAPVRAATQGVELIRPLLECRRSDIEQYCRERGLEWREDASNADTNYRRNFIRHDLLASIRRNLNPRAEQALLGLAEHAAEIDAFMRVQSQSLLDAALLPPGACEICVSATRFKAADPTVQACALRQLLEQAGLPMRTIGARQIRELRAMLDGAPRAMSLGRGVLARRDGDTLVIGMAAHEGPPGPAATPAEEVTLDIPGTNVLPDGWTFHCRIEPFDQARFAEHLASARLGGTGFPACGSISPVRVPPNLPGDRNAAADAFGHHAELIDAGRLRGPILLRPRRDGDTFRPLGSTGGKSVSDFLTDIKLPHHLRRQTLCLCDELGIVCVWPLRIDERVKITEKTSRVLRINGNHAQ